MEHRRKTARAVADERQQEAFKAWANWILKSRGFKVSNLAEDFSDGVLLIQLAEILTAQQLKRYNKNPSMTVHKLENVQIALSHLQAHGLSRTTIKSQSIVEKDGKAVLSLFWQMIIRYQLGSGVRAVFRGKGDDRDINNLIANLERLENQDFQNMPAADVYDLKEDSKLEVGNIVEVKQEEAMGKFPCKKCGQLLGGSKAVLVDRLASYHLDCFVCCTCNQSFQDHYWELDSNSFDRPVPVKTLPLPSLQLAPLPLPLAEVAIPKSILPPPIVNSSFPAMSSPLSSPGPSLPPPMKNIPPTRVTLPPTTKLPPPPSPTQEKRLPQALPPKPLDLTVLASKLSYINELPPPPSPVHMERPLGPYCFEHYLEAANLRCAGCNDLIRDKLTRAMRKKWHNTCFACSKCKNPLSGSSYYEHEGKPYCMEDFYHVKGWVCARCDDFVQDGDKTAMGKAWHRDCFVCMTCNQPFGKDGFYNVRDFPYCPAHYQAAKANV